MKRVIFVSFAIFFLSSLLYSQWQADIRLTNNPAQSYLSSCPSQHNIVSSGNTLHVTWFDERNGNWNIYYIRSTNAGANWEPEIRLTTYPADASYPSLAVSGLMVYLFFEYFRDGNWEIYYFRSSDGGANWGTETRFTNDPAVSEVPNALVSGATVHVVWFDNRDGNYEIYYKRTTNDGVSWSADTRLTNYAGNSVQPAIAMSGSILHIVWFDYRDGNQEIFYKRSTDSGISWGPDTRLSSIPNVSEFTTLAVSGSTVHVVWHDARDGSNFQIYYRRSTDAGITWGTETRLTSNSGYSASPNITVSGLNAHVTWQDNRDGNFEVYYIRSTDGGSGWGPETRLTNASGNSLRTFSTVTGTAVHVIFIDERDGNWEIYYKKDPTGNPPNTPPPAPVLSAPPNGSFNQPSTVRFIWYRTLSAVTYRFQLALDSIFTNIIVNDSTLTDSTIVVANLLSNRYMWWRVNAKNLFGTSSYSPVWKFGTFPMGLIQTGEGVPEKFKLFENYPNPFNPTTKIKFDMPRTSQVSIQIYSVLGEVVAELMNESSLSAGSYEVDWNAGNYASSIYYYRITAGSYTDVKKMVLIK